MMRPRRSCSISRRAKAADTSNAAFVLTSNTRSNIFASTSSSAARPPTPALFTSTHSGGMLCWISSRTRRTASWSATSTGNVCAVPPAWAISSAVSCSGSGRLPSSATCAPVAASVLAACRPSPEPAPVTIAVRSRRPKRSAKNSVSKPSVIFIPSLDVGASSVLSGELHPAGPGLSQADRRGTRTSIFASPRDRDVARRLARHCHKGKSKTCKVK